MPKKKLKVKPLGGREAIVVPPRSRPKKKMTKEELEAHFQKIVKKKWDAKQISKKTYEHYSSPTRHAKRAGDPTKWEQVPPEFRPKKKKKESKKK